MLDEGERTMIKTMSTLMLVLMFGFAAMAEDLTKPDADWTDVTREVAANPAEAGGWVKDESGKVFRSADGNTIRIQHGSYGIFKVDLPGGIVYKIEGEKETVQEDVSLLQRDSGQTLVIKTKEYKFKVQFTEKIAGMKSIQGIKSV